MPLQTDHHTCRSQRGHGSCCPRGRRVPESLRRHKEQLSAGGPAPGDLPWRRRVREKQSSTVPAGPSSTSQLAQPGAGTENATTDSLLQDAKLTLPLQPPASAATVPRGPGTGLGQVKSPQSSSPQSGASQAGSAALARAPDHHPLPPLIPSPCRDGCTPAVSVSAPRSLPPLIPLVSRGARRRPLQQGSPAPSPARELTGINVRLTQGGQRAREGGKFLSEGIYR